MNEKLTKHLYWSIKKKFGDYVPVLYAGEGEEPSYESDSLMDKYDIPYTTDKNLIYREVANDFTMSYKDKLHLWKLLDDFSIENFLNDEQDYDFLEFLWKYNFRIGIIGE